VAPCYPVEIYDTHEQMRATEVSGWYQWQNELFPGEIKGQVRRNGLRTNASATAVPSGGRFQ